MARSWKARQMVPGKDTLATMAMHYGISHGTIIEVISQAEVNVIREDGFNGFLEQVSTNQRLDGTERNRNRKVMGWSDGQAGVDATTTKLTRPAIMAVAQWKFRQDDEENGSAA